MMTMMNSDDEWCLWYGWPSKGSSPYLIEVPYFQENSPAPKNCWLRAWRMKLLSSANRNTAPRRFQVSTYYLID